MLIREYKLKFLHKLKDEYSFDEANSLFHILIRFYLGLERIDLALDPSKKINAGQEQILDQALYKLSHHEPVQYITGETEFFGNKFRLNNKVLIPRPETEDLVQWIHDDLISAQKLDVNILDIGTGSGCIAVSLARIFPQARISAMDISGEALKIARENALSNGTSLNFIQADILEQDSLNEKFDIIVSNPPYVRELEKDEMHRNVLEHEPSIALYVKDDDPLVFYKKITKLAEKGLHPGGRLYFEINQYLGDLTLGILRSAGFEAELRKDFLGNDRMIRGIKKN